jgi:hypothetical protein
MVVLSENDWNTRMSAVTVAGVFRREEHPSPGDPTIVDLGSGDYIDCTQIFEVLKHRVGATWPPPLNDCELALINEGVRSHLCLDQLKARLSCASLVAVPAEWVPEQGMIRKPEWPAGDFHLVAMLSATQRNETIGWSTGVVLVSGRRTQYPKWEVPIAGGCTVAGNIATFPNEQVPQVADGRRANRATADELAAVAEAVERALGL